MATLVVLGLIVGADGQPATGRKFMLQGFGANGWSDVTSIEGGEFQVEFPFDQPLTRVQVAAAPPLRIVAPAGREQAVVADAPMLQLEGRETVLADFGEVELLAEPYSRRGLKLEGQQVLGAPAGLKLPGDPSGGEVVRLRAELSRALTELAQVRSAQGTPTRVVDVIAGLGTQLSATNLELAKQPTPFRLTDVKLDLRGRLGDDGSTIVLDGLSDGSGLTADLVVDAPDAAGVPMQGVPSVLGLTESAASRVLRSVGFRMETATQRLPQGGVAGQALTQHPAAGEQAEFGTSVLVIFGSESNE